MTQERNISTPGQPSCQPAGGVARPDLVAAAGIKSLSGSRRMVRFASIAACCGILSAIAVPAQAPPPPSAVAQKYAENAQKNAMLTKQYTWKMRVTVTLKGEAKPPQLYQINFDASGKMQKTLLTAPQDAKERGLRGRIKEDKIEEFQKWAASLSDLVKGYMAPSPGQVEGFYAKATISMTGEGVLIKGNGLVQPGDTATYWINKETMSLTRFEFASVLQGDPVQGKVTFARVPDGPQYANQVNVSVPAKEVSAVVENFDYQK